MAAEEREKGLKDEHPFKTAVMAMIQRKKKWDKKISQQTSAAAAAAASVSEVKNVETC